MGKGDYMTHNLILLTDSYKMSHHLGYPPGTERIYSYFESRGGIYPRALFFGLQYYLKKYLAGIVISSKDIEEANEFAKLHFGNDRIFNHQGWSRLLAKHNGRLPISIKAVPEGTLVPCGNVLMTIENTDPEFYWLTNYLETLLVQVWYPTTVASQSYFIKQNILKFLEETGDPALIDFKLHDFGFRGVSSVESAGIGGCAHLVNFMGTDTIAGAMTARNYYGEEIAGFSIPAAEHSTITSWGRENEVKAFENMLDKFPKGLVAVVSDSYNIFEACEKLWGEQLRERVLNRDGTVVIRPDSGDPVTTVLKVLDILGTKFGFTCNNKGYKVLDPHVRVIQGDGVNYQAIDDILTAMKANKWSADNIAFGSGGALLQRLNRDTLKFGFKCSSIIVNGTEQAVYKEPVGEEFKKSKPGRMKLVLTNNRYHTITDTDPEYLSAKDELVEVFRDGKILKEWSFSEIRGRAK